jgi:hypothetical protein
MIPHERRTQFQIAAVAAPILVFCMARVFLGPTATSADTGARPAPCTDVPVVTAKEPTPEQERALAWIDSLAWEGALVSPFARMRLSSGPGSGPSVPIAIPLDQDATANLRLTAVLGNSQGGAATINGRIHRAGDVVAPGVRLVSVDARGQRVQLMLDDGRTVELRYEP